MMKRTLFKQIVAVALCLSLCITTMVFSPAASSAETMSFPDVAPGAWYYEAVQYVADQGFMTGYGSGRFGPTNNLKRQDYVVTLARIADADLTPYQGQTGGLSDVVPNTYYAASVAWGVSNGVVTGYGSGRFGVGNPITREQICTILWRYVGSPEVDDTDDILSNYQDHTRISSYAKEAVAWSVREGVISGSGNTNKLSPVANASRGQIAMILMRAHRNGLLDRNTNDDNLTDDEIDRGDIEQAIGKGDIDVIFDNDGSISTIDGAFIDATVTTEEDAADVLNASYNLFGESFQADAENVTIQTAQDSSSNDESFYRYRSTVDGVPVLGGEIILSTDADGAVNGLYSTYNEQIQYVDTYASIDEEEACNFALNAFFADDDVDAYLDSLVSEEMDKYAIVETFRTNLSVQASLLVHAGDDTQKPALVYAVDITGDGETIPFLSVTYYIYANSEDDYSCGEVHSAIWNTQGLTAQTFEATDLNGDPRTFVAQGENGTYQLHDPNRNLSTYKTTYGGLFWISPQLPGELVTFTNSLDKAAVSAHANMEEVYDYYYSVLGRDSYNGHGKKIVTSYDYDNYNLIFTGDYANAFWTSDYQQFVFGDAGEYEACLDVVAHEFTHAVINYVVGNGHNVSLTYYGESGALNEAYADIMGSLVEGKSGTNRWLISEDAADGAIRNMADPSQFNQPEHYSNRYTGDKDKGGVHYNSGIFNFAAYKMMTDRRTNGVSMATWAKIFYRSMYRLASDATFLDARGAILCAAKAAGFDSTKQQAIKDAFDAVGITEPDAIRIVLTWGLEPLDLDSHLVGPAVAGSDSDYFHVYYNRTSYFENGQYYSYGTEQCVADLDYDDTTSFGPEITSIHVLNPGTYHFFVHDYTNRYNDASTALAKSGAVLTVYGNGGNVLARYTVDGSSIGTYWNAFDITINEQGAVTVSPVKTYTNDNIYTDDFNY